MSTDYARFRQDNTEGYTDAQLAELNRRFAAEVEQRRFIALHADSPARKAVLDHIAERVQAEYDTELSAAPTTEDQWARSQGFV